jgi:hypothetical protein
VDRELLDAATPSAQTPPAYARKDSAIATMILHSDPGPEPQAAPLHVA